MNRKMRNLALAAALTMPAAAGDYRDPDEGLVGYWNFDEGEGGVAHDSSGHGNHGIIHGAAWTTGISQGALQFDGADDYVYVGDQSSLDGTNQLTIALWVQFHSFGGSGDASSLPMVSKWYTCPGLGGENSYLLRELAGVLQFLVSDGTLGCENIACSHKLTVGSWYHVAAVFDEGRAQLLVNGVLIGADNVGVISIGDSWSPFRIGDWYQSYHPGYRTFHGLMDDVRIYNRALSKEEIQQLYEADAVVFNAKASQQMGASKPVEITYRLGAKASARTAEEEEVRESTVEGGEPR